MPFVTTPDGTEIFYKDWGAGRRRVPPRLAAQLGRLGRPDDVLRLNGYRVIAHDRRGHGRSAQSSGGHDMGPMSPTPRCPDASTCAMPCTSGTPPEAGTNECHAVRGTPEGTW